MLPSTIAGAPGTSLFDSGTPVHVGIGFAAGLLAFEPSLVTLLVMAAKATDMAVSEGPGSLFRAQPESLANATADVAVMVLGFAAGNAARRALERQQQQQGGFHGKIV